MSSVEISSKIKALQELEGLIDELRIEADVLRDSIKAKMQGWTCLNWQQTQKAGNNIGTGIICHPRAIERKGNQGKAA